MPPNLHLIRVPGRTELCSEAEQRYMHNSQVSVNTRAAGLRGVSVTIVCCPDNALLDRDS